MPAFQWTYIICLIQLATSQSVDHFTISTTAAHPGDDATNLEVTLYWEDNSYTCSFPTSSTTEAEYNCNDQAPYAWSPVGISQDNALPYYLQFKWMTGGNVATSFIEIDAINVTLDNGFWYTIDHFCIHSMMSCTSGLSSTQKCGQWSSKDEYNTFKMGSTTNFQLLYVDFRSNITGTPNFANLIHEGSVRPPNLVQLGLSTAQTYTADAVSAQWDNKYYRCTGGMTFIGDSIANWTCDITESKTCPGVNSSFWWSIQNDATGFAETITVTGVQVTDETNTTYRMSQWCHALDGVYYTDPPYSTYCTELATLYRINDLIPVGGRFMPSQVAFIAPDSAQQPSCLFAYPDVFEPDIDIAVLSADGSMKGWGQGKYGGIADIVCPVTLKPTAYPTFQPTFEPTWEPTWEPTFDPTFVPTSNPTFQPTHNPTNDPTWEPTWEPTFEPTFVPTSNPTFQPTADPTFEPTAQPTHNPTKDPTSEPTQQPTYEPTTNPTDQPTQNPTSDPTYEPTTNPTFDPTSEPTYEPSTNPIGHPSSDPTLEPTSEPTYEPTNHPTTYPTADPTSDPTFEPTNYPTTHPTNNPTYYPTSEPTFEPTSEPTYEPSNNPTSHPSSDPTHDPTYEPTSDPTTDPTSDPTFEPTNYPTTDPTADPTADPTFEPTNNPTTHPTADPSTDPTFHPTFYPTYTPTAEPTLDPTATTENVVDDGFVLPYNIEWIEGIIAIVALLICCLLFAICCWCYRRRLKAEKEKVNALGGNITAGAEMTETTKTTETAKTTIVLNTEEEEQKDNEHGFEAVPDDIDIKLEDSDEMKLEQAWTEGGEGGKSIDTINTMNTGDFVGSLDGVRDTGNKDDAALDLILDGAPTQREHRESVKFTV